MTYEELYNKAIKTLNLDKNMIDDWRPASPLFIDQLTSQIPNAIIIWLNTGEKIIFINKNKKKIKLGDLPLREIIEIMGRRCSGWNCSECEEKHKVDHIICKMDITWDTDDLDLDQEIEV